MPLFRSTRSGCRRAASRRRVCSGRWTPVFSFTASSHSSLPHQGARTNPVALGGKRFVYLVGGKAIVGAAAAVFQRGGVKPVMHVGKRLRKRLGDRIKPYRALFAVVGAAPARTDPPRCPSGRARCGRARPSSRTRRISSRRSCRCRPASRGNSFSSAARSSPQRSSTPGLCWATGIITACTGATAGGSTSPLSSPWVMIIRRR